MVAEIVEIFLRHKWFVVVNAACEMEGFYLPAPLLTKEGGVWNA